MKRNAVLFIHASGPFSDILEAEGYQVVPCHGTGKKIEKKIWLVQPEFIVYFVGNLDFDGLNPLEEIPRQFRDRTITISKVIDGKALLDELNRRRKVRKPVSEDRPKTPCKVCHKRKPKVS